MFKKLLAFAAWAVLLCLLFILCLLVSVNMERSFLFSFCVFVIIITSVLLMKFIWHGVSEIFSYKIISRFMAKFKFTRMEFVLYEHWKTGEKVIKRVWSRKKRLPWFILTGGRCGKTTLMASAGLPLFSNEPESSLVVPTRTLRWWFFRSAGFLDLSSHFLDKTPSFERAWLRVVSWCGRLPAPAGIIVSISVSDLLNKNGVDIHLSARHIRTQIQPLMKKVKRRLPVYLFITCCDQLPGFSLWVKRLSPSQRQQALGYHWLKSPVVDGKDPSLLDPLFTALSRGLDTARVSMLSGKEPDADMLPLLDFPEQIGQLQPAIHRYLAALCEPDSYFEPGSLGGVWFTATESVSRNSAVRQPFFLHDLLTVKLPALSRQRECEAIGFGRRYLQQWGAVTFFGFALLMLIISGLFTYQVSADDANQQSVAQQLAQLEKIELLSQYPLRYLPFIPVLNHRHQQLEDAIIAGTPRQAVSLSDIADIYQQKFRDAEPQEKRRLILNLSQTITTQQQMLDKKPISELLKQPVNAPLLSITGTDESLTRLHDTVLQRALLKLPGGVAQVQALRQLLVKLINSDPEWQWIVGPAVDLPFVSLTDFVPESNSEVKLNGQWTLQGTEQVHDWLAQVRQAVGEQFELPILGAFEQQWPMLRQKEWMKFMLAINHQPLPKIDDKQWQRLLISIDQGNSPAMKFAHLANEQLADISPQQTAPWLKVLRHLNQLQNMPAMAPLALRASRLDQSIRQKITSWLHLDIIPLKPSVTNLHLTSWDNWRNSLRAAVADAVETSESNALLTRGLFQASKSEDKNPLQTLNSKFMSLRKSISPENHDFAINAVWALYQTDANLLVTHAMQRSGCWIQQQWQSQVLWPMGKNVDRVDYEQQQRLAWQYLTAFIRGPAKNVLVIGDNGPASGEFEGQNPGLTPEFLRVVNNVLNPDDVLAMPARQNTRDNDQLAMLKDEQVKLEAKMKKLETKSLDMMLTSMPATIPGGARLMPTGTKLEMFCADQRWSLNSMNFSEKAMFHWRPGNCSRVTQIISFPGFNLQYDYLGDSAWPDFLADIADGQQSYSAEDFPEEAAQLATLGITDIMVRYQIDSQNLVHEAWQKWQDLNQAINDNTQAQEAVASNKAEQRLPTALKGKISQLPTNIAECH